MKKVWYSFSVLTSLVILLSIFSPILASAATSNEIDYYADPRENPNLIEGIDYDIETITIDNVYEINSNEVLNNEESFSEPQSRMVVMPGPLWKTTDVTYVGEVVGKTSVWDTSGKPGITIGTTFNKSVTATVSETYGASYSALSANLNFTIGVNYGVSSSGSYTVPSKYNGKNVSQVTLKAYPKYKKYSMKVHKRNDIYFRYDYKGISYAQKPTGINFDYIFYYK